MWNSGGKNFFSKVSRSIFGPQTKEGSVQTFSPEQLAWLPKAKSEFADIGALKQRFSGIGDELISGARSLDVEAGEGELRRRMREGLLPALAARGLATGGKGVDADLAVEGELAQKYFERSTKRQELLQQAAQGLAVLESLPAQLRAQILQIVLGKGGTPVPMASGPGILQQLLSTFGAGQSSGGGGGAAGGAGVAAGGAA